MPRKVPTLDRPSDSCFVASRAFQKATTTDAITANQKIGKTDGKSPKFEALTSDGRINVSSPIRRALVLAARKVNLMFNQTSPLGCDFNRSMQHLDSTTRAGGVADDEEKTTARQISREPRRRICQRFPLNAIPGVYKTRETCSPDQESTRETTGCVQALPIRHTSCPAILDRYHDSRNQAATQRLLSLRFHARRSRSQLFSHQRCRRDPAARQSGYSLPKIPM